MDASVRAAGACRATAMTPRCATEIAALATSGRPGWSASLRHVLLAVACALGAAPAAPADTPANTVDPANTAHAVTGASRNDPAISPRDSAVRQVVLGIISFTRWPTPPARLRLCVTGRADYAQGLVDTLQAGSTPLEVQHVQFDDSTLGTTCQVVYLGDLSDAERQQVSAALAGHPVLTIAEHDVSCTAGSMFCLNVAGERVTFDINLDAVARSGVRVHPNVLNLARRPVTP
ncbi:YfiR family protein [Paraburkholderia sp. CNPSo 3274]|uniref:YfiR family protein n=1 Tax=Paraburkholderia sp. CNPSo 3274 TaxID=2940932 RepID=UPI0020B75DFD|nr:YfiR family protein [Paraburkholderia sp. CNPSo 3274]MCP3711120.1 YfiR family protein [Paraburkholderia sp. CNPSo 3274]